MTQRYAPGLFDRLIDDQPAGRAGVAATWMVEQLKEAIARDLESLLNTRAAMPEHLFAGYPEASKSVLTYGLIDFAGMCMTSDTDQKKICSAVQRAIERHEPRLHQVSVDLRPARGAINRVEFVISAQLKGSAQGDALSFDAVFRPSLQQYSIERTT